MSNSTNQTNDEAVTIEVDPGVDRSDDHHEIPGFIDTPDDANTTANKFEWLPGDVVVLEPGAPDYCDDDDMDV